jgi:hypothetical protein
VDAVIVRVEQNANLTAGFWEDGRQSLPNRVMSELLVNQELCLAQHFSIDDCRKVYRTSTRTF